jgi:hypothetical protein
MGGGLCHFAYEVYSVQRKLQHCLSAALSIKVIGSACMLLNTPTVAECPPYDYQKVADVITA